MESLWNHEGAKSCTCLGGRARVAGLVDPLAGPGGLFEDDEGAAYFMWKRRGGNTVVDIVSLSG